MSSRQGDNSQQSQQGQHGQQDQRPGSTYDQDAAAGVPLPASGGRSLVSSGGSDRHRSTDGVSTLPLYSAQNPTYSGGQYTHDAHGGYSSQRDSGASHASSLGPHTHRPHRPTSVDGTAQHYIPTGAPGHTTNTEPQGTAATSGTRMGGYTLDVGTNTWVWHNEGHTTADGVYHPTGAPDLGGASGSIGSPRRSHGGGSHGGGSYGRR